jgi:16S rRNA (guanine527-N7)-methyltransferase
MRRRDGLLRQWGRAQRLGFLGPGPVEEHLGHAALFRDAVEAPARAVDLGSGGGVPGLALALWWEETELVLVDASTKRTVFLSDVIRVLDLTERVSVVAASAEEAGRDQRFRARFDVVVARGFGPPAVAAECGAAFLRDGGALVVSDPPTVDAAGSRWPAEPLSLLGLTVKSPGPPVTVLVREGPLADEIPRRAGVPAQRPRW